jgi:hypothetical protein|tara:strand:- start:461 stop:973 length:513 start_codon:yes stop_codon:yes gene_type:complete
MKKIIKIASIVLTGIILSGCQLLSGDDSYQEESRKIINYLLADMPLPDIADIQKEPTVILGTGSGIAGRIVLNSPVSPASNLIFYSESTLQTGWVLISSTVAEEIVLIYTKDGRYATIEIMKTKQPGFFGGESSSQITISVVHPGAIQEQNPYLALGPKAKPTNSIALIK